MKKKKTEHDNMNNFFKEMSYELAGDIGVIDNEDMVNNKKITNTKNNYRGKQIQNKNK